MADSAQASLFRFSNSLRLAILGLVFLIVLGIVFGSWYTVDAGERAVVLRLGALEKVTGPGLHFKMPFIEDVRRVPTRVTWIGWLGNDVMEAYSKDQQPAKLQVKIAFRVLPDDASIKMLYTQYRDIENYSASIIEPRALEGIKTIFGQFNAVTAIQERARLNSEIDAEMQRIIAGPVRIEGVQIQDITFSDAYEQSVEQRMLAQVEVEKFRQNKDREQLQADIKVIQATAGAQSVRLQGEAEASAIEARGKALRDNPQLVSLVAAEKWDGKLPTTQVPGSAVPFVTIPHGER